MKHAGKSHMGLQMMMGYYNVYKVTSLVTVMELPGEWKIALL